MEMIYVQWIDRRIVVMTYDEAITERERLVKDYKAFVKEHGRNSRFWPTETIRVAEKITLPLANVHRILWEYASKDPNIITIDAIQADVMNGDDESRFRLPKHNEWDGIEDNDYIYAEEYEDDTYLIEQIRDMGICIIEEPLTCCDEIPEPEDLTEQFNKIVEDPIGELVEIERFPIWSHKQRGIVID